jgi:[CysO sulfur-carrier protein]-S-L-cysteine hydrolase
VRLRIPASQLGRLRRALERAGTREIGGQLYGEQLAPSDFRTTELAIQKRPGTFARFLVDLIQAARDAAMFFERTQHRYARFNYIGEWHSHPSFDVYPSSVDVQAMEGLVREDFRGNFAVLLIAKLEHDEVRMAAWVFDSAGRGPVTVEVES